MGRDYFTDAAGASKRFSVPTEVPRVRFSRTDSDFEFGIYMLLFSDN